MCQPTSSITNNFPFPAFRCRSNRTTDGAVTYGRIVRDQHRVHLCVQPPLCGRKLGVRCGGARFDGDGRPDHRHPIQYRWPLRIECRHEPTHEPCDPDDGREKSLFVGRSLLHRPVQPFLLGWPDSARRWYLLRPPDCGVAWSRLRELRRHYFLAVVVRHQCAYVRSIASAMFSGVSGLPQPSRTGYNMQCPNFSMVDHFAPEVQRWGQEYPLDERSG